jgi:branched-chain amino acid transport system substrate-binding protein
MMDRIARAALASAAGAALLGVPIAGAAQAQAPVTIPVIVPLTGGFSYAGQVGKKTVEALAAQVNKHGGIHGHPVKFVFYDDQGVPQTAVQVTTQAMAEKPVAVIGSMFVALCQAMAPITQGKALQYCYSPGVHPAYGSDLFSASIATDGMATAMLRYMRDKGWKRVASIVSTDASGQDAEAQLKIAAALPEIASKGVSLVDLERFNPTDPTVLAQMQRIRASNPDVVVMWTSGAPFGTVVHAFNDAGLTVPAFTTNANLSFTFMKQFADFLPKNLYFPAPAFVAGPDAPGIPAKVRDAIKVLYAALKAADIPVDFVGGNCWDPPSLVIDGLRHLPPNASYAQLRTWILEQRNWAGVAGNYDFTNGPGAQRGLTVKDTLIVRWDAPKSKWDAVSKMGGLPL